MEARPTVFVVDDDASILRGVTEVVELLGMDVRTYATAEGFLDAYRCSGSGCLVLDVRMPGMSGPALQQEMASRGISLPVIIITGHGDVQTAVETLKLGAVEFLEKPFRIQELSSSIQKAIRLDEEHWRRRREREEAHRRLATLTAGEREVMDLVVTGKTNRSIAQALGLSLRGVEARRTRMVRKLGVRSRAELMELAVSQRGQSASSPWVPLPPGPAPSDSNGL